MHFAPGLAEPSRKVRRQLASAEQRQWAARLHHEATVTIGHLLAHDRDAFAASAAAVSRFGAGPRDLGGAT